MYIYENLNNKDNNKKININLYIFSKIKDI